MISQLKERGYVRRGVFGINKMKLFIGGFPNEERLEMIGKCTVDEVLIDGNSQGDIGNLVLKNRVMFPPLTTGYEEKDGSIGPQSLAFYKRLAEGGVGYVVIGGGWK